MEVDIANATEDALFVSPVY